MKKPLHGIHHVTAITSSALKMYEFFTDILGMRLVKKNVNQDDLTSYHIYFGDDRGNPGTAMTFFDFKGIRKNVPGTNEISRASFRVRSDEALKYWEKRFNHYNVNHDPISNIFGYQFLFFEDFDNQRYAIVSDEPKPENDKNEPWLLGPVPNEYGIVGLGPIFLTVSDSMYMQQLLVNILGLTLKGQEGDYYLYEMLEGGTNRSVIVKLDTTSPQAQQGYGGVHHVAFRVEDENELNKWIDYMNTIGLPNSGFVERFYFKSLYTRLYPNILFEFATDGPGFIDDEEDYEQLGQTLTLPPHLRNHRAYIETQLAPFNSIPKNYEKEYLNEE